MDRRSNDLQIACKKKAKRKFETASGRVLVGRMRNYNSISPDSALMKVWTPKAVKLSSPGRVLVGRMRNYNRRK